MRALMDAIATCRNAPWQWISAHMQDIMCAQGRGRGMSCSHLLDIELLHEGSLPAVDLAKLVSVLPQVDRQRGIHSRSLLLVSEEEHMGCCHVSAHELLHRACGHPGDKGREGLQHELLQLLATQVSCCTAQLYEMP